MIILTMLMLTAAQSSGPEPAAPAWPVAQAAVAAHEPQRNIRSGRHVEVEVDAQGAAIWATFHRPRPDSPMQMLIARHDPDGTRMWTVTGPGRATSVTPAGTGHSWVVGFVEGASPWDEPGGAPTAGARSFLVKLDEKGHCKTARFGPATFVPMLIRSGRQGQLVLVGEAQGAVRWDDQVVNVTTDPEALVGFFAPDGRCQKLIRIEGNVVVNQCAVASDGGVILGGQFRGQAGTGEHRLTTTGAFDHDGLLGRMNPDGSIAWLRALGSPGNPRPHHRSRETVSDLVLDADGTLIVAAIQDDPKASADRLVLDRHTAGGQRVSRIIVADEVRPPGSIVLARSASGAIFIGYTTGQEEAPRRSLILEERTAAGALVRRHQQETAVNTMFRCARVHESQLWLFGHFHQALDWGAHSLRNDGFHQLFSIRQPLQ